MDCKHRPPSRPILSTVPGVLVLVLGFTAVPAVADLELHGLASVRGVGVTGQRSWTEGGFGRLRTGGSSATDDDVVALVEVHLALDWRLSETFGIYVQAVGREEPGEAAGREAGIIEAWLEAGWPLRRADRLRFRLGHFFLPTSRENVDLLWASPYTVTFSAINTWIGQEVRPTGFLGEYSLASGEIDEVRLGGTVFRGNDTAGALLAWRGWSLGDRLTAYDEVLPLPPLDSLSDPTAFGRQLEEGTRPFGDDLDGRLGWAGWLRWQRPERAVVQWTRYENRGDRHLYHDEYSWDTELDLLSLELHWRGRLDLAAEWMSGHSGMGRITRSHVQTEFEAAYVLVSWSAGPLRLTLRYDTFEVVDLDRTAAENNDEDGEAATLAVFWQPSSAWRLGAEIVDLDAERPAAAESGFDPDTDARSVTIELRYFF